jgi:two-component system, NarL family, response regulator LiaR
VPRIYPHSRRGARQDSRSRAQVLDVTQQPDATAATRILIVDDHPTLREGLRVILDTQEDFQVAGEAANGEEAVAKAEAMRPDVVLMDLEMPVLDGVEATRRIVERLPGTPVIVLTAFDTDDRIIGAVEAGAQGYLLKGATRDEIFRAIRVARQGGTLLQPAIASKLLRHVNRPRARDGAETISEREREVLALLVDGLMNKEIARRLSISERTVKFHVASILGKLGVPNRAAAVRVALEQQLVGR